MQREKYEPSFRLPEKLVRDITLSSSAKQLALVLFCLMAWTGTATASQRRLAALSGLSLSTVNTALPELKRSGYLSVTKRRARYSREKGRYEGQASVYHCCIPEKGYVLVPYRILRKMRTREIRCADIPVLLYLLLRMNKGRAYPSLSKIARETGVAVSSICGALKALYAAGLLYIQQCIKRAGSFACNSYFLLHRTRQPEETAGDPPRSIVAKLWRWLNGYFKFQNNRVKLKITLGFKRGEIQDTKTTMLPFLA